MGIQYRDQHFDPIIEPATHVQYVFLHFSCHDSNQFFEYEFSFASEHAMNRDNKRIKMFPLLVRIPTVLVFIIFLPLIQEWFHCLLIVGLTICVPHSDANDGISIALP